MSRFLRSIPWSSNFEFGIPEIDDEHRTLIALYNDIVIAASRTVSTEFRQNMVRNLSAYASIHFGHEEEYMRRCRFPGTAVHIKNHREFSDAVDLLTSMSDNDAALAIGRFLEGWIQRHIAIHDRALFDWVKRQEQQGALGTAKPCVDGLDAHSYPVGCSTAPITEPVLPANK